MLETNIKIFYGALPCGYNLKKWKKSETDKCTICCAKETILHLLYECKYAQEIWSIVEDALQLDVTRYEVFMGHDIDAINHVFSLILYYIYKDWLILSLENKKRQRSPNLLTFSNEIKQHAKLYASTSIPVMQSTAEMLEKNHNKPLVT